MITTDEAVLASLGVEDEIGRLRQRIDAWVDSADPELREALRWALAGQPKHFRPLTVFACRRAMGHRVDERTLGAAFVVELMHNMTLVVDDVLDGSPERRGVATLQRRFGTLPALMASGYLVADAFAACAEDSFAVTHLAELLRRLGAAECLQWRLRRQPLGVADWRRIAGEDTGSMFEACAVLGAGSQRLRRYGHLLGVLYHGCDDVGDLRGLQALGGGGDEDIADGILTLPAALAIRDPDVRQLFLRDGQDEGRLDRLAAAYLAQLDEAEAVLDGVADLARTEAREFAADPAPLICLVEQVRQLSGR
ncbi:MAG TPA: polyprenyl synthetase family protein [Solirubrobacteraceae bacterium]|nr:polyprenyl synthetase family protein [Solirubrobacteraceae bacterium]